MEKKERNNWGTGGDLNIGPPVPQLTATFTQYSAFCSFSAWDQTVVNGQRKPGLLHVLSRLPCKHLYREYRQDIRILSRCNVLSIKRWKVAVSVDKPNGILQCAENWLGLHWLWCLNQAAFCCHRRSQQSWQCYCEDILLLVVLFHCWLLVAILKM